MRPKRRSLGLEVEVYPHFRGRARLGKHFRKLLMILLRAVSQMLRGEWAMQALRGSIRPTESSATRSQLDIDCLAKVIGGSGLELRGFVKSNG
jgi:hypothetical protein